MYGRENECFSVPRTRAQRCSKFADTKHIASLPEEFRRVLHYINELGYQSTPDYEYISNLLKRGAARSNVDLTEKFDWIKSADESEVRIFFPYFSL